MKVPQTGMERSGGARFGGNGVTWFGLLTMPAVWLRKRGVTTQVRYDLTGHRNHMSERWAGTVGMWGCCSKDEILQATGASSSNYQQFKRNWALDVQPTTGETTYEKDYRQAKMAYGVHMFFEDNARGLGYLPEKPGDSLLKASKFGSDGSGIPLLPMEIGLYIRAMDLVLLHGVTLKDFAGMDRKEMLATWYTVHAHDVLDRGYTWFV